VGSPKGREPQGDGAPVVVAGATTCQGGRESRPQGQGAQVAGHRQDQEVCEMQDAETVLGVLRERGRRGLPCDELYRQLFLCRLPDYAAHPREAVASNGFHDSAVGIIRAASSALRRRSAASGGESCNAPHRTADTKPLLTPAGGHRSRVRRTKLTPRHGPRPLGAMPAATVNYADRPTRSMLADQRFSPRGRHNPAVGIRTIIPISE
jgi:hypothetical protein